MRICRLKTLLNTDSRLPMLVKEAGTNYGQDLNSPARVADMLNTVFSHGAETEEVVYLLALDSKKLIGVFELSRGTVDFSAMNPREVLMKLLLCGAVHAIVAHNHPSGDPEPSGSDIDSTGRLQKACSLVGIRLLDSMVLGEHGSYVSFHDRNIM